MTTPPRAAADLEKATLAVGEVGVSRVAALYVVLGVELFVVGCIYGYYGQITLSSAGARVPRGLLAPALLGAASACLSQLLNQAFLAKPPRSVQPARIAKFGIWGAINAVTTNMFFDALEARFDMATQAHWAVILDQGVNSPLCQLLFVMWHSIWDDLPLRPLLHTTYLRSLRTSYAFWPFVSVLTFFILPPVMMFPVNCVANVVWTVVLGILT